MASVSARLNLKRTVEEASNKSKKKKTMIVDRRHRFDFYDVHCEELAKKLLGQVLVRVLEGEVYKGTIVETEAYLGSLDKAAHSYKSKKTARNEAMFMAPGTAYVYSIYGMYHCLNISSSGEGAAVLIRAVEPLEGVEDMKVTRARNSKKKANNGSGLAIKDLCNGPSKLCSAFKIDKDLDKVDMTDSDLIWVEAPKDAVNDEDGDVIISCPRIGVNYAEEWSLKNLRFYLKTSTCVSKRDKTREQQVIHQTKPV